MLAALPIQFDRPYWLLLLLLIVPTVWLARGGFGGISRVQSRVATSLRVIVIALLALALAQPAMVREGEGLTLMMIVDVSRSIPLPRQEESERFLREVARAKRDPNDRIGVVTVARDPAIAALPHEYSGVSTATSPADLEATNLAAAVRTALALLPQDTANRILLVSDGNETEENVLAAVEVAKANGIPVDVLPIQYEYDSEVTFEGLRVPTRARLGQPGDVRMFLRSQAPVSGTLRLFQNDIPIDLDPSTPGDGLRLTLKPGPNVISQPVEFSSAGTRQFRAIFEPDDERTDAIAENNVAVGVTFVSGEGRVLIVAETEAEAAPMVNALAGSDIEVETLPPDALVGGLPFLNGYDAIVLMNVPKWSLALEMDDALHAYVHDLGGGLVMTGGPESFGAGGWIDSSVAKALPVRLDPPATRELPSGALALIMHSCEMPQGNFWGQQVAIAAIEALSSRDYVGIVTFGGGAGGPMIAGSGWAFPMQLAGDKSGPINAAKKMLVGDMPDFGSSMQLALNGLTSVNVGQRHGIIISDGDPSPPSQALLNAYKAAKITITTVMVAGHGSATDMASMKATAAATGGRFYNITNPKNLPQIFVKEAKMISRSLIVEEPEMQLSFVPLPGPVASMGSVPPVSGYVLTARREGLAEVPVYHRTKDADDPIYANWNYGLGKAIAFTSDATGRWGRSWINWNEFRPFWEQSIRWVMRPPTPQNIVLRTRQEGDKGVVELEALSESAGFLNFLRTEARLLMPDNQVVDLALQQIGPGRYRGEFALDREGAYLVNVAYSTPDGSSKGTVQGAVATPYAREFRSVRDNLALLQAVADRTGGRVLRMDAPELADFYERRGLEMPRSPRRIWDVLTIIAAALLVLDVASRRIAIDQETLARLGRLFSKPAEATGDATVAAWKRAREQAQRQRGETGAGQGAGAGKGTPPDRAVASRRFDAEEAEGASLEVTEETAARGERPQAPSTPTRPGAQAPPDAAGDEASATSRLLEAKRRALRNRDADGGASPGKGDRDRG